jgi:protein TonB
VSSPAATPAAPTPPVPQQVATAAPAATTAAPSHDEGPAGGTAGARAILQPKPEIPEQLRHQAINLVAIVHFAIAPDGSATATLDQPTPDPRLNRVLLDAFRRWRFFPALDHGKPVASTLTLRVPVTVD